MVLKCTGAVGQFLISFFPRDPPKALRGPQLSFCSLSSALLALALNHRGAYIQLSRSWAIQKFPLYWTLVFIWVCVVVLVFFFKQGKYV